MWPQVQKMHQKTKESAAYALRCAAEAAAAKEKAEVAQTAYERCLAADVLASATGYDAAACRARMAAYHQCIELLTRASNTAADASRAATDAKDTRAEFEAAYDDWQKCTERAAAEKQRVETARITALARQRIKLAAEKAAEEAAIQLEMARLLSTDETVAARIQLRGAELSGLF
jgi:hypothetical protein